MKQLFLLLMASSLVACGPSGVPLPEQPPGCNGDIDRSDERLWEMSPSSIHDICVCMADRAYIIERILEDLQCSFSNEDYLCDRLDDAIYQARAIREDMGMELLGFLGD